MKHPHEWASIAEGVGGGRVAYHLTEGEMHNFVRMIQGEAVRSAMVAFRSNMMDTQGDVEASVKAVETWADLVGAGKSQ